MKCKICNKDLEIRDKSYPQCFNCNYVAYFAENNLYWDLIEFNYNDNSIQIINDYKPSLTKKVCTINCIISNNVTSLILDDFILDFTKSNWKEKTLMLLMMS